MKQMLPSYGVKRQQLSVLLDIQEMKLLLMTARIELFFHYDRTRVDENHLVQLPPILHLVQKNYQLLAVILLSQLNHDNDEIDAEDMYLPSLD